MKRTMLINPSGGGARAIRACYGKCSFESVFLTTGHGITGVIEIYER